MSTDNVIGIGSCPRCNATIGVTYRRDEKNGTVEKVDECNCKLVWDGPDWRLIDSNGKVLRGN